MIARRDLLIGGACVAAAAAGTALKPRRHVSLLGKGSLATIVPASFGDWRSEDTGDPLAINGPETLSARLYNQLVARVYRNERSGEQVFMLLAYGGKQTDQLQLHRPEICYPAFGFTLLRNEPMDLNIGKGVEIPARRILADGEDRTESVVYWSRMGEFLPRSGGEQREDRLRIALQGIISDGLLSRFSTIGPNPDEAWARIEIFVASLIASVAPAYRKVLIGTERADRLRPR